jgi:cold shock CspA family protein
MTTTQTATAQPLAGVKGRCQGFITHFNKERRFGFIQESETKARVFFHASEYGHYVADGGDFVQFRDTPYLVPTRGIAMTFVIEQGRKGPVARMVGSLESYEAGIAAIENRPTYRFMERRGSHPRGRLWTEDCFAYRVFWEGKNLHQLRYKFPRSFDWTTPVVPGRVCRYFEVWQDGKWVICDDPR